MKYFLDSTKEEEIEKWLQIISGVTSNPFLFKQENTDYNQFIAPNSKYKDILKFVQIKNFEEAVKISKLQFSDNVVFKIPMVKENFSLIKKLKQFHLNVAATTCYDLWQINQAIELECDFTMVYHHKNRDKDLMEKAYELKQRANSQIDLVGASIKSKHEIERAMLAGMNYVTISPLVMAESFYNEQVDEELRRINELQ